MEPPPEPKWARTSRRYRHEQRELASSSGHGASSGQSGNPGPSGAPFCEQSGNPGPSGASFGGQSGNPGPSGAPFCVGAHQEASEFRTFVGKLYLRTHGKSL